MASNSSTMSVFSSLTCASTSPEMPLSDAPSCLQKRMCVCLCLCLCVCLCSSFWLVRPCNDFDQKVAFQNVFVYEISTSHILVLVAGERRPTVFALPRAAALAGWLASASLVDAGVISQKATSAGGEQAVPALIIEKVKLRAETFLLKLASGLRLSG